MNFKRFSYFLITLSLAFLLTSCPDKSKASFTKHAFDNSGAPRAGYKEIDVDYKNKSIPASSIVDYIKPVYITETPAEINPSPETISNSSTASNSKKTQSVVPGLRPLKDYQTVYNPKREKPPKPTERVESPEFTNTTTKDGKEEEVSFYIEDWGPYSTVAAENRFPTFYVVFSQPVRALTSLGEPSETSDIMKITPPLKGKFVWYGTQHLSFEASEPADPSIEYTITIDPKLKSNGGQKLKGQTTFVTKAEKLALNKVWPGYSTDDKSSHYSSDTGAVPPHESKMLVRFNYMVDSAKVRDQLVVRVNQKKVRFTCGPDFTNNFSWYSTPLSDKKTGKSNTYVITIRDKVPHNAFVELSLKDGDYYDKHSFYTLRPFYLMRVDSLASYPDKNNKYSINFSFSQIPDKTTLIDNIKINVPGYKLTEKNISVSGTYVTIYGLPLQFEKDYSISFTKNIRDIYGQYLDDTERTLSAKYSFKIKPMSGYVRYLDYGVRILEAQFPHKLLFEYMNADGHYTLSKTTNPLDISYNWGRDGSEEESSYFKNIRDTGLNRTYFESDRRNTRNFEEIDLNPYLSKDGYGFVRFYATGSYSTNYNPNARSSNHMTVQVTDLGVTARNAINKSVYLVTSMSTGKPVANADVYVILGYKDADNSDPRRSYFAKGKTDKNGLCVINYNASQVEEYLAGFSSYYSYPEFCVFVEKGNDKVFFIPSSHNSWREGVTTSSMYNVNQVKQRTFMFTDRGLYKPGETVTFRGIDRDQVLGTLKAVETNYTIRCEGAWWDSSEIIKPMYGSTSENGGFYGSFKIPDNTEPGTYLIKYYRDSDKNDYFTTTFTVAYFEKVKSQASITGPETKHFADDTLSAKLNASYLAGGALSNAQYYVTWYLQQTSFKPKTTETRGFSFGSNAWYSDKEYWSDSSGNLDSSGAADISCSTKPYQGGDPYIYRAEANVTDVSNQRIYTSNSFMVHPASFYAGIKREGKSGGYPKINQDITFSYILVDTDGNKLTAAQIKDQVNSLSYTVSLETWKVVHEQSVDDTIYTRYEEVQETVKTEKLSPQSNKFNFKPTQCGWYTVAIEGSDERGKQVRSVYHFYATGGSSYWYDRYNSQSINITTDQNEYNPGDTAQLLLESSIPAGDYLITVEREGIFTEEVRHFDSPSNVINVKIASNYVPVVYVSVASYSVRNGAPTHQYGETDLDKPKGYYGVAPIFVNPYVRAFSVKVESDKNIYKPGETARLTLTATKNGKPVEGAELTAMAVDRGVLDLINYHVPDPITYFYDKYNFPLYVKGGDSRSYLMDPVSYSIKNLQGGDSDDTKDKERKDFRPTAFFEPALITDKNGTVKCSFKMPDSLTTYRVTAFGVKDDMFALQEKEIQAQNPVNVQQVQPRRMRERDTAECGVLITNLQDKGLDVTVSIEARTPTKDTEQDIQEGRKTVPGKAFVDGPSKHTVYVAPGDSTVVYFDVAAQTAGTVELVYTIKSNVLNEKLISPVIIEKTYVYETVAIFGQTTDDKKTKNVEELALPGFAKDGRGDLTFTLDATRLGLLGSSVNYLFEYPYGCMEQQSSKVLPLVLFGDYIDVFEMKMSSKISNVKKCVTSFTQKWGQVQHRNGGFPYWPDDSRYENFYVSLRLAYIYGAAKERGYTDKELGYDINALVKYLKNNVNNYSDQPYLQAYYCFVLKMLGDDSCETLLNKLNKEQKRLTISEEALLGLAYNYSKSPTAKKRGKEIADGLRKYLQPVERTVTVSQKDRNRNWYWYNDKTEEIALLLQLYAEVNPNDKMVDRLLLTLLNDQKRGYWQSTTTTAHVLDAIYHYIQARNLDNTNYNAKVAVNSKEVMNENFKGVNSKPKTLKLPFEDEILKNMQKDKILPVTFTKDGTGYLFYTLEMKYALPDEMQNERDEGIKIEYSITDYYTGELINKDSANNPSITLEDGKIYKATIRVESKRDRSYLALRCPVPSGAEILDSKFVTIAPNPESYYDSESYYSSESYYDYDYYSYRNYSNQSILDNEVQYFWDSFSQGSRTVSFSFRTTRRGVYPTPPVQAECMYEPEVFGRSDGYLIQIK